MGVRAALDGPGQHPRQAHVGAEAGAAGDLVGAVRTDRTGADDLELPGIADLVHHALASPLVSPRISAAAPRSEEHTSELQSLMRISYAVFCLQKKTQHKQCQQNS